MYETDDFVSDHHKVFGFLVETINNNNRFSFKT